MIGKVDEDLGVGIGLEDFSVSTSDFSGLSLNDGEEILWGNISTFIVDVATSVDILAVWLVEDLAWEWILRIVRNVIISQGDDLIFWDSVLLHNLIGVADIGLMTIVAVTV